MRPPDRASAADADAMSEAVARLEHCFVTVHRQRMRDVPILNRALSVKAVGFRRWGDFWLGALVTPWFINLVMLPVKADHNRLPRVGEKLCCGLPAGNFAFTAAYEETIGSYLACSLLSPVLEIHSQQMAEEVACASLQVAMQPAHDLTEHSRDEQHAATQADQHAANRKPSRRELLQSVLAVDAPGRGGRAR